MAKTAEPPTAQLELDEPLPPPPDVLSTVGKMTIELLDTGHGRPIPKVTFSPVGRFTPALMQDHVAFFAQEIQRAQAQVRHAERTRVGE